MSDNDDEPEVLQFRLMNGRGERNGGGPAAGGVPPPPPPSRAARAVSPDNFLAKTSSSSSSSASHGDHHQRNGDAHQFGIGASQERFDPTIAGMTTIVTCSYSCPRSPRGHPTLNAYEAFVRLARDRAPTVQVVESSGCVIGVIGGDGDGNSNNDCRHFHGGCAVEVRHELSSRVRKYANLRTESDAAKVWSCVETLLREMEIDHGNNAGND